MSRPEFLTDWRGPADKTSVKQAAEGFHDAGVTVDTPGSRNSKRIYDGKVLTTPAGLAGVGRSRVPVKNPD